MEKRIYLLRHGETLLNGRYVGSTDVELSADGRAMIADLAHFFSDKIIDQVYCSPMKRCLDTFMLLEIDGDVEIDEDLREIDFGLWEGLSFDEIVEKNRELVDEWSAAGDGFSFPAGESVKDFGGRVERFSRKIIESEKNSILIVAHGGTLRYLLCLFLGLDPEKKMVFAVTPGCLSEIILYDSGGVLAGFNLNQ
jgi:broad specificity phosphatase PhoE